MPSSTRPWSLKRRSLRCDQDEGAAPQRGCVRLACRAAAPLCKGPRVARPQMNNGCVCCTVRGDLIRILNKLIKRKGKFDAILM
jgi:hypothetical protein